MFVESLKCRLACLPGSASGVFPLGASHVWNSATRLLNLERGFMVVTREAITFFARQHALWTLAGRNSYVRLASSMGRKLETSDILAQLATTPNESGASK